MHNHIMMRLKLHVQTQHDYNMAETGKIFTSSFIELHLISDNRVSDDSPAAMISSCQNDFWNWHFLSV